MNSLSKAAAIAVLAAVSACAETMEDTVATVNGTAILLSEYQKELSTAFDLWARTEPAAMRDAAVVKKLREGTLDELINRELLYQEGKKQGIKVRERDIDNGVEEIRSRFLPQTVAPGKEPTDEERAHAEKAFAEQLKQDGLSYAQFRERLSKQIMARKLVEQEVRAKVKPPEEKEIKAYFDKIRAFIASKSTEPPKGMGEEESLAFMHVAQQVKGMSSERVRVSRILIRLSPGATAAEVRRASATAAGIYKRLIEGAASFAEIAREESEDPESAARGGDAGYVLRGVAPPEFETVAFSLPVGEISKPIRTDTGFHIIRVSEKRAAEEPDYERFKDDLAKFLFQLGFQKELEGFVKNLRTKAVIERNVNAIQ